jgi:hypothetical protein
MAARRFRCLACGAVIALLAAAPAARACTNDPEKQALVEASKEWDPYGKALVAWNEGSCPCNKDASEEFNNAWKGIKCEDGRITEINLGDLPSGSLSGAGRPGLGRAPRAARYWQLSPSIIGLKLP